MPTGDEPDLPEWLGDAIAPGGLDAEPPDGQAPSPPIADPYAEGEPVPPVPASPAGSDPNSPGRPGSRSAGRRRPPPDGRRRPPGPTGLPTGPHPLLPAHPQIEPATYTRRRLLVGLGGAAVVGAGLLGWKALTGGGKSHSSPDRGPAPATGGARTTSRPAAGPPGPALAGAADQPGDGHVYDTVIEGGRVIDPDSGFDATAHVGVDGSTVTAVSTTPLKAKSTIDAAGLVVCPGFIDLLSNAPDDYGARFKIADGVTTNLGMHGLEGPSADFFARYQDKCMVNFGGALRNPSRRAAVAGLGLAASPNGDQVRQLADDAQQQIQQGWIGIDFEPEYIPGTSREEMAALGKVAQQNDLVCTFHGRYSSFDQELQTIDEVMVVARDSGARCHIEHLVSTGGTFHTADALAKLSAARQQGLDISACTFPYGFWAAPVASTRFDPGWDQRFRITYNDLQVPGTTERLTEATFNQLRSTGTAAVAYAIPDESVVAALKDPDTMIGSDAILALDNHTHPAASGCFSRVLGRYVRDQKVLDLRTALAKMTIMPAKRFGTKAPALAKKGRLARGADADISVFDPKTVIDRSTVEQPAVESTGVQWVLVMGQQVRTPMGTNDVHAGQPIRFQA